MNKKLLSLAAIAGVLGLLNLMSHAEQRGQAPFKALVSPATCAQPQWPNEARRYEIEGVTTIRFQIGEDGKVVRPEVSKSSGWKILDDAAIKGISRCVFQPNLDEAKDGASFPMQFVWQFSDGPVIRPLLVADSCQPSERFQTFKDSDPPAQRQRRHPAALPGEQRRCADPRGRRAQRAGGGIGEAGGRLSANMPFRDRSAAARPAHRYGVRPRAAQYVI